MPLLKRGSHLPAPMELEKRFAVIHLPELRPTSTVLTTSRFRVLVAADITSDVVMTTLHENETLEEALDFFIACAIPTQDFFADSSSRPLILDNPGWAEGATRVLQSIETFG